MRTYVRTYRQTDTYIRNTWLPIQQILSNTIAAVVAAM